METQVKEQSKVQIQDKKEDSSEVEVESANPDANVQDVYPW